MGVVMQTIKIKAQSEEQGEFIIINACDFDETIHQRYYEEGEEKQPTKLESLEAQVVELSARAETAESEAAKAKAQVAELSAELEKLKENKAKK